MDRVLVSVLKYEICFPWVEPRLRDTDRLLTKPLISEPATIIEPDRVLCSERPSVKLADEVSEALRDFPKPLSWEAVTLRELDRLLANPLISEPATKSELAIDLKNEDCLVMLEVRVRVLVKALPMPFV